MLRIFHPTDFSMSSDHAFAHALRLAVADDSELTLLHVELPSVDFDWDDFPSTRRMLERWDFLDPTSSSEDIAELGIAIECVEAVSRDTPGAALHYLRDHPADLMVLSTEGRKGLSRLVRRSTAESLSRAARMMTLFVPQRGRGFVDLQTGNVRLDKILLPVTADPDPAPALRAARSLAHGLGVTDAHVAGCWVGAPAGCPLLHGEDIQISIRQGQVSDALVAMAKEIEADLIVMTTHGHDSFGDVLRGSTTERVIREAPCPVLAVPALLS